jgi:L-threonylcarbamoyladenylate synthase
VAQKVAALAGGVVTATSANFSGEDAARSVDELGGLLQEVDLVIDSGPAPGAPPSTVVGWGDAGLIVYREGALATSLLQQALKGRG